MCVAAERAVLDRHMPQHPRGKASWPKQYQKMHAPRLAGALHQQEIEPC
jgi:hypothetical protein